MLTHILICCHQEPSRTTCRVTNRISRCRGHHINHQVNNMAGRAKLPIRPRGSNLRKHILINIAIRIPIIHRNSRKRINHLRQQRRGRNRKTSLTHMLGVARRLTTKAGPQPLNKREHPVCHRLIHSRRRLILKIMPTQMLLTRPEHGILEGIIRINSSHSRHLLLLA